MFSASGHIPQKYVGMYCESRNYYFLLYPAKEAAHVTAVRIPLLIFIFRMW